PVELLKELPKVGITRTQFQDEVRQNGLPDIVPPEPFPQVRNLALSYKMYWGHDRAIRESCRRLLSKRLVNVFAVVFRIIDVSSHLFWTYMDPVQLKNASTPEEIHALDEEFGRRMEPVYMYADAILGEMMQHANSHTNFIICSDHGFKFDHGRYGHSFMEEPPDGILILNGPAFRHGEKLQGATLLDITTTLLYLKGVPIGKD